MWSGNFVCVDDFDHNQGAEKGEVGIPAAGTGQYLLKILHSSLAVLEKLADTVALQS